MSIRSWTLSEAMSMSLKCINVICLIFCPGTVMTDSRVIRLLTDGKGKRDDEKSLSLILLHYTITCKTKTIRYAIVYALYIVMVE